MCNSLNTKTIRAGARGVHWECCSLAGKGILQGTVGGAIPVCGLVLTQGRGYVTLRSVPYTLRHDICFLSICHAWAALSAPPALRLSVFDSDSVQPEHL